MEVPACGSRPVQYIRYALQCCSLYQSERVRMLLPEGSVAEDKVLLELETDSTSTSELRVSFRLQEKQIMRRLTPIQGMLYVLLKIVFQRLLRIKSLRAYHAKTLLFYMLERHRNENEWKKERLIALLKESLKEMIDFLGESRNQDRDCMPSFFMPDVQLTLRNAPGDLKSAKMNIASHLGWLIQKNMAPLIDFVKQLSRPQQKIFQPFTVLPLVEVADFKHCEGDALLYLMVQSLFKKISTLQRGNFVAFQEDLLKLRWLSKSSSVSECLLVMAHLRFGDVDSARQKLRSISWRNVEPSRFCFPIEQAYDFGFLPQTTQSLIKTFYNGNERILQVNFRSIMWSLQCELLPRQQIFLNEWCRAIEDDPDVGELSTLAHYSRNPTRLRNISKKMDQVISKKPDASDVDKAWNVKSRTCFYSLMQLMLLSACVAALSQVPVVFKNFDSLECISHIAVVCLIFASCIELTRCLKFAIWLQKTAPSADWRRHGFTSLEFAIILPLLSVALSILANRRLFLVVHQILTEHLLPDLMLLHSRLDEALVQLVLALK